MNRNFEAKFKSVIEAFSDFNARNDDCEYCPFFEEECNGNGDEGCLCGNILKLLKRGHEHEERIDKLHARTIKGEPNWTNVAEHLPPTPGKYLVYSKVGTMYTSSFNPDIHKRWPHFGKVGITHWMPRPEEPKEE